MRMQFFPKYGRKVMRMVGHDYAQPGYYSITMCTQNRVPFFGEIRDGEMHLNDPGRMVDAYWHRILSKFSNIDLDAHVVMPDHMHAILYFSEAGADPRVRSFSKSERVPEYDGCVHGVPMGWDIGGACGGGHVGPPLRHFTHLTPRNARSVSDVIQWFKTVTTNAYIFDVKNSGWQSFSWRLWQRSFYDDIVWGKEALWKIRRYIHNNPKNYG